VITDGWPTVFAKKMLQTYSEHSVSFSITVPGLKVSHSIYMSFFTGEPVIYFWVNRDIVTDCIFDAMFEAQYNLTFMGYERVIWEVLGEDRRNKFAYAELTNAEKTEPPHNILFRDFPKALDIVKNGNSSLITYSTVYDVIMHDLGYQATRTVAVSNKLTEDLVKLKSWIDKNPEYLLILSSDHGVDGPGNLLHGHPMEGNDGYLMFYNPSLATRKMRKMDVVDVAPTLTKYLKGVDIPASSVGMAMNYYGNSQRETYWKVLTQNLKQLIKLAQLQDKEIDSHIIMLAEKGLTEFNVDLLEKAVMDVKGILYQTSTLSVETMLVNAIAVILSLIYIFGSLNSHLFQNIKEKKNG